MKIKSRPYTEHDCVHPAAVICHPYFLFWTSEPNEQNSYARLINLFNKLFVFLQWVYSYLTYKRGARIITGAFGEPPAGSA